MTNLSFKTNSTDYSHKDEDPLNLTSLGAGITKKRNEAWQAGSMQETCQTRQNLRPRRVIEWPCSSDRRRQSRREGCLKMPSYQVGRLCYRTFQNVSGCELEKAYSKERAGLSRSAGEGSFGTAGISNKQKFCWRQNTTKEIQNILNATLVCEIIFVTNYNRVKTGLSKTWLLCGRIFLYLLLKMSVQLGISL